MESAIALILFYHVILRPFKILPPDHFERTGYDQPGLVPRFSYFTHWREYEHAHTLCWLGKDLSWDTGNIYFWPICLVPTIVIAADFIWITFKTRKLMIDTMHYVAQLLWVLGNMLWAMTNVYEIDSDDDAKFLFTMYVT
jgi:hypothetical protein